MEEFSYAGAVSGKRGKVARVANTMRLVALHHSKAGNSQRQPDGGHARAILALPLENSLKRPQVIALGLSVRETERLAGWVRKGSPQSKKKLMTTYHCFGRKAVDKCGTAVSVRMSNKGRGNEVHFYNLEELERICEALL